MKVVLLLCLVVLCKISGVHMVPYYPWTITNPDFHLSNSTYQTVGYVGNQKSLLMQVKASRDGHIMLSESTNLTSKFYEWELGGADNVWTQLRLRYWYIVSVKISLGMLAGNQWRWFWMDWSDGAFLKVGEGLNIHDPASVHMYTPLNNADILAGADINDLKFLSLSAYGNTVRYRLHKTANPCFLPVNVYNQGSPNPSCANQVQGVFSHTITNPAEELNPSTYTTVGFIGGQTSLLIQIKGDRDAHLVLSHSATNLTGDLFEHVIGGWFNSETTFRSPIFGPMLTIRRRQFGTLSAAEFRWFWVEWSDGLTIKAGVGSNPADSKTMNIVTYRNYQPDASMRFLSLSAFDNTVYYKILRDTNQCYLTLAEYNNRVQCGNYNPNKCIFRGCCWDSLDNFCYKKA